MLLLFSKSNMSSVTKRYLIMSKYPYCKINVMKTWAASLRATQNICSDNWNNRDFVLTMLVQENIWSFSLNFFLLFLGIINFYIYSSYSFISSITIKNMLHSWKKICIARNALYNKSNSYRKHTKIRATELYLWVLGSTSTCFGISIHCCQNSKQNPKGPHICLFNVAYVLSSVPFTFIWRFAVRNMHNRLLAWSPHILPYWRIRYIRYILFQFQKILFLFNMTIQTTRLSMFLMYKKTHMIHVYVYVL